MTAIKSNAIECFCIKFRLLVVMCNSVLHRVAEAYAAVTFSDDNSVSVVPETRLDGDFAYWAPYHT